ncbi:MAG TPA: sulfatase-like hydrolase/transferase [Phycisphaerae bacterium]|nr:sulfatase-like hydrolase/transferase [Phycisphaerae bacterium]
MSRPNILIFMTDHQRGDTVLPEHPCITPNLDRLARDGVAFTETYCPSPHCCPARATFATGLYPSRHGVWNNICNDQALSRGVKPGVRMWSEDLAAAGYDLAWTGKWHVSVEESPTDRGWNEIFASAAAGDVHGGAWDYYRKLAARDEPAERGEGVILRPGYGPCRLYGISEEGSPHDERVAADALKALPDLAAGGRPWVLYAGAVGPHDPYCVPRRFLDMYDLDDVPLPASYADSLTDKPRIYKRMRDMRYGQLTERETRDAIRHFWAYCTYLDDLFGKILAALDETGQADNTLVLYCSDHGDYCGDHGLFAKGIPCFREAYHVPAVMRWPAGIRNPGRREEAFVSLADFAPTFVELAGRTPDEALTGRSLVAFLDGRTPPDWRDEIHTQCNGVELYYTQRSVMTRDQKYVFNGFDDDELYDLRTDPREMRNLAAEADLEPVKRDLVRRMWRFAHREQDTAINQYITVALAPYGPAEAFREP